MPSPKRAVLAIDADPVRYRVGFAGEKISYWVAFENADGEVVERTFEPMDGKTAHTQIKEYEAKGLTVLHKEKHVEVEPVAYVLQMVDVQMESIIAEVSKEHDVDRRDLVVQTILSGKGNYREKIATLKVYKGNRDPTHKPTHFAAITEHLMRKYGAYVTEGREADDEISIRAHSAHGNFIISTIDKDLDQIPGWHYDYMKKVHYHISEDEADDWFWRQVLTGDATDNIGGACAVGPASADAYIADWFGISTPSEKWDATVALYAERANRKGCYYCGRNAADVALENARLVYLQHEPGELWTPPGMPKEYLKTESVDD